MKVYQCPQCDKEIADWELPGEVLQGEKPKCPECGTELEATWDVA